MQIINPKALIVSPIAIPPAWVPTVKIPEYRHRQQQRKRPATSDQRPATTLRGCCGETLGQVSGDIVPPWFDAWSFLYAGVAAYSIWKGRTLLGLIAGGLLGWQYLKSQVGEITETVS